jgi:hypothetical protein
VPARARAAARCGRLCRPAGDAARLAVRVDELVVLRQQLLAGRRSSGGCAVAWRRAARGWSCGGGARSGQECRRCVVQHARVSQEPPWSRDTADAAAACADGNPATAPPPSPPPDPNTRAHLCPWALPPRRPPARTRARLPRAAAGAAFPAAAGSGCRARQRCSWTPPARCAPRPQGSPACSACAWVWVWARVVLGGAGQGRVVGGYAGCGCELLPPDHGACTCDTHAHTTHTQHSTTQHNTHTHTHAPAPPRGCRPRRPAARCPGARGPRAPRRRPRRRPRG